MGRRPAEQNGGWGAFDADNTYHYLNNIPFADHGALLDPPTEDVTGRCIGMLAQLGEPADSPRMKAAIDYLRSAGKTAAGSAAGASITSTAPGRRWRASRRGPSIRRRR
jgi:squalene cyclase